MLKKLYVFLWVMLFCCYQIQAQKYKAYLVDVNINAQYEDNKYCAYKNDKISVIKGLYKDSSQTDRSCVESVIMSYFSAKDQAWFSSLYEDKEMSKRDKDFFERAKKSNPDSNFMILQRKMYFNIHKKDYCIIKFHMKLTQTDTVAGCLTLEKNNNRWLIATSFNMNKFVTIFRYLNNDALDVLFLNKSSSSTILTDIQSYAADQGKLDINRMYKKFNGYLKSNDPLIKPLKDKYYK